MKNIVLIILLLFTTNLIAQREYGDPAKYPYSTNIPDNSTVQFRINGTTMIVTWLTVKNIVGANSTY
ncbi:MAG: hypothetical protein IPK06_04335 [Ignavibacteriae bacterium]|nr:hypothetical protein [Ignavibacteriota bacterium]